MGAGKRAELDENANGKNCIAEGWVETSASCSNAWSEGDRAGGSGMNE